MNFRIKPRSELNGKLTQRMERSMHESGYPQLEKVQCEAKGSTAILSGRLDSYYLLQVAQTAVGKIPGVQNVDNRIEVSTS